VRIGLRIDVDTLRGTRDGVPNLLDLLRRRGVSASFFFSVGPDNMGRHLRRLARPAFAWKMLRTRAASLYGWDILLRGTFWPGPRIGEKLPEPIRAAARAGHEIGFHAWDHHAWQARIERMDAQAIRGEIDRGCETIERITGRFPGCAASPGWRCTEAVLRAKRGLPFLYHSDCRGESVFRPVVDGEVLDAPQVPVTLPTYDELLGRDGVTAENYNERLLARLQPAGLNVLTIHAEAEGLACLRLFDDFVSRARAAGASLVPLGELLPREGVAERGRIARGTVPGREGWVACQAPAEAGT